jgi:glycosyltransferase involved in cell wall biosynthesis
MSKIIYLPLEELPARYTQMMNAAIYPKVDISLYPKIEIDTEIKRGQFLDIVNTCKFKAAQLQMVADLFNEGKVENGDAFLIGDIFFPGIEMIKYMSELLGINVRVYGINYAGRADKTDFVQQLSHWADASEAGYHFICDGIFVGSEHHNANVCEYFKINSPDYVHTTGYVWDLNYMNSFKDVIGVVEKEEFVIWPHRWCAEKGINELCAFAKLTDKKIVVTSSGPVKDVGTVPSNIELRFNLTKLEYFTLMSKAKWYLSTAYQETQGYTILEAIYFGCNILVPDRACCPEMVPLKNVYTSVTEIDKKFDKEDLIVPMIWTERIDNNAQTMINIIKGLDYKLYNEIYKETQTK